MKRYQVYIFFLFACLMAPLYGMQLPMGMQDLSPLLGDADRLQRQLTEMHATIDLNEQLAWQWICMLGVAWSLCSNSECKRLMTEEVANLSSHVWQKILNAKDEKISLNLLIMGLHGAALTGNTVVLRGLLDKLSIQQHIIGLIQHLGAIWLLLALLRKNDLFARILLQNGANKEEALCIVTNQLQQLPDNFITFLNMTFVKYLPLPLTEFIQQLGPIDITIFQKSA